ncbi:unnamed protein product [Ixodes persulcatus]
MLGNRPCTGTTYRLCVFDCGKSEIYSEKSLVGKPCT